jgi:hypothetical protein
MKADEVFQELDSDLVLLLVPKDVCELLGYDSRRRTFEFLGADHRVQGYL